MGEEQSEMAAEMPLADPIPLTAVQIEAAAQLRSGYMPFWKASGDAMDVLAGAVNGFDLTSTLLKVSALSRAYGLPYLPLETAVSNLVSVMSSSPSASVATVNAIVDAMAPSTEGGYRPLASKFVHFFVAPYGAVPLWDKWSRRRVNYHMGRPTEPVDSLPPAGYTYAQFFSEVVALRASVNPLLSFREMDSYLWLAGQYTDPSSTVPELEAVLAGNPEVEALLAAMLG